MWSESSSVSTVNLEKKFTTVPVHMVPKSAIFNDLEESVFSYM